MRAGLLLAFTAYPPSCADRAPSLSGRMGVWGDGSEEARWGKWKFCHRELERVLDEKKVRSAVPHCGGWLCPGVWLFWALSLSFQKALPLGLLCNLG